MTRHWIEPLVQVVESWFDDTVSAVEYQRFVRRSIDRLGDALKGPGEPPPWAAELRLAVDNLGQTSLAVSDSFVFKNAGGLSLPTQEEARAWLKKQDIKQFIKHGTVERFTAKHILVLVEHQHGEQDLEIKGFIEKMLRHVEVRRKDCLRLRHGGSLADRWFERHDASILMALSAREFNDLRYLNVAMKLMDWALPVHRRSVPADLLARYILAISEVQIAMEKMA